MTERFSLTPESRVMEVASNDGYLLQYFRGKGIPCLGIEPTANTAEAARAKGIETREVFFGSKAARELAAGISDRNPKFTDKEKINLEIYAERQGDPHERERILDLARDRVGNTYEREGAIFRSR